MTSGSRPRQQHTHRAEPTAPVVTICGSMRFCDLMLTVAADETRAGNIVLMPFAVVQPDDQGSDLKAMLDLLHREKIAMSDRVIVVSDQTGYYGTSTQGEIEHATRLGLPVDYWRLAMAPHTVPCWFGCGYLADSEADLDTHEAACERADQLEPTFYASTEEFLASRDVPAPRPAPVARHRDRRGGAQQ